MPLIRWATTILFLLAVPTFLVLTNVRIAAMEQRVYSYSFSTYDVENVSGIDRAQLDRAAAEMIQYFKDDEPLLATRVRIDGEERPLFSPRETLHMRDVKQLFQNVFFLQEAAFVYIGAYVTAVFLWARERSLRRLAEQCFQAGVLTALLLVVGAAAVFAGFDSLFRQFHLVSFSNDFWELDPAVDHLVQMFPQSFWYRVSLVVGLASAIEGALVAVSGFLALRWLRQPERERGSRARVSERPAG